MVEMLKKSIYATIGIALMTREKAETIAKKVAAEAKLSEADGKQFVDELLKHAEETRGFIEKMVAQQVDAVLHKVKIPTSAELDAIDKRLQVLESAATREPS